MVDRESSQIPKDRRRGRAAAANPATRFDAHRRVAVDDGWDIAEAAPQIRTEVRIERPRTAITRNTSPDLSFDRSINPYRGCEHGCIYCYARPSHAYLNLSPGLDFETRLIARPEMPEVLARELASKSYRPAVLAIGSNTDPYQPVEAEYRIMRRCLEVLWAYRHPVAVVTKGSLVERDVDILGEMARLGLARVGISIATLDADLARRMEPRVPPPLRRLQTIRRLSGAGVPVRAMVAPVIPGLTDPEIEPLLEAARDAGAVAASWTMLRLPREVGPLFRDWLTEHYPDRAARVMNRVRDVHGGRDYDPTWGKRMRGEGVFAKLTARRFQVATARLGLDLTLAPFRTDLFRVPPRPGDQLSLF